VAGADTKGLVITGVQEDSPAAESGMKTGDVILDVAGKPVTSVGEMRKTLADARKQGHSNVLMRVKSGDTMRFVALPLRKA
jgi:serine protease Do